MNYINVLVETDPDFFCMYPESFLAIPRDCGRLILASVNAYYLAIWTAVEPGLGIIASSFATTRPLFRLLTARFRKGSWTFTSSNSGSGGYGNGYGAKQDLTGDSSNHEETVKSGDFILQTTAISQTKNKRSPSQSSTAPLRPDQLGVLPHISPGSPMTTSRLVRSPSPTVASPVNILSIDPIREEERPRTMPTHLDDLSREELILHIEQLQAEAREWRKVKQLLASKRGQGGLPLGIFEAPSIQSDVFSTTSTYTGTSQFRSRMAVQDDTTHDFNKGKWPLKE
jgi:hypothetical protein